MPQNSSCEVENGRKHGNKHPQILLKPISGQNITNEHNPNIKFVMVAKLKSGHWRSVAPKVVITDLSISALTDLRECHGVQGISEPEIYHAESPDMRCIVRGARF